MDIQKQALMQVQLARKNVQKKLLDAQASMEEKQNQALATRVGKAIYDSYGSWDNIKRSFAEHPAQVLLDLSNVLDAGGSSISKIGEVGDLSKIADAGKMVSKAGEAINPISGAFKVGGAIANKTALGEKISGAAKFGVSQATGLSPETITEIAKNPSAFSKEEIANASRESLASTVKTNIDKRLADLSETGKEYNPIKTLNSAVSVPKTAISEVLNKFGITLGEDGKIIHTAESTPMSQGDINQIQGWIDKYGNENIKNPNSFLNARQATGKIANFASGTTTAAKKIGTALYAKLNEIGRPQIQGLAELDSKYSPETQMLKKIKADWLDKSGNLKDTAMTRIANLTKAGREQALSRLENISPGITQKVNSLRAIEDIKNASGLKVGTYYRGAAGAAGLATLNIPMIAASILSIPEVAVPVIKAFGMGKEQVSQLLGELSKYSSGASLPEGTAACLCSIDTAWLHLATATNIPVVALVNPKGSGWARTKVRCGNAVVEIDYDKVGLEKCRVLHESIAAALERPNNRVPNPGMEVQRVPRKIFHCCERHEDQPGATLERKKKCWASWDTLYEKGSLIPAHLWEPYPRTADKEIGDSRALPYIKDVIKVAMDQAGDEDIILWTNDDNILHPEVADYIQYHVAVYGPCVSHRSEFTGNIPSLELNPEAFGKRQSFMHPGRDLFAATKKWLVAHWDEFGDYILGCTEFDYFLAAWVRREYGIQTDNKNIADLMFPGDTLNGYVAHIYHEPHWRREDYNKVAPGQKHNRALFKTWGEANTKMLFNDDGSVK